MVGYGSKRIEQGKEQLETVRKHQSLGDNFLELHSFAIPISVNRPGFDIFSGISPVAFDPGAIIIYPGAIIICIYLFLTEIYLL